MVKVFYLLVNIIDTIILMLIKNMAFLRTENVNTLNRTGTQRFQFRKI